jgi:hypothetical protein
MAFSSTARRRWIGGIVLFGAVGMLICGQTFLKSTLAGMSYLIYWLVCFGLTGLAVFVAILDVRALSRHVREEHRDLLDSTLKRIETEAKGRSSSVKSTTEDGRAKGEGRGAKSDPPPSEALRRTGGRGPK